MVLEKHFCDTVLAAGPKDSALPTSEHGVLI
jgi:hypothetical protein